MPDASYLAPAVALIGVAAGATLQFVFGRHAERQKQFLSARTQAYVDYVTSSAELARVSPDNSTLVAEVAARNDVAKYKICIYGSQAVIEALAAVVCSPADTNEIARRKLFISLCSRMRDESAGAKETVDIGVLIAAVYGEQIPLK